MSHCAGDGRGSGSTRPEPPFGGFQIAPAPVIPGASPGLPAAVRAAYRKEERPMATIDSRRATATTRIRRAADRGRTDWGWLDSRHTFSFGDYHDPAHMGFRALRVINDDRVAPGAGFGSHGHRDMEILSYVLEGALAHQDSMGTGSVIRAGEIQMMRAGTGVVHSEYNASKTQPVHFLQIWIVPDRRGLPPAYGQNPVDREAARRGFALLASKDGRDQSLQIQQ